MIPFSRVFLVLGADCQCETFKLTHPVVLITHLTFVTVGRVAQSV